MTAEDLLDRIDQAVADTCHGPGCTASLAGSVSDWFCSPPCQAAWTAHDADVQEIVGYREAMSRAVGWCEDEARWEPTITVGDWTVTVAWARGLLMSAIAAHAEPKLRPKIARLTVSTTYVPPERTDDPNADAFVADVAARWADRLGLEAEAAAARTMADEARREYFQFVQQQWGQELQQLVGRVSTAEKALAEAFKPMQEAVASIGKALAGRPVDLVLLDDAPGPGAPTEDRMARALQLRQRRNTGPTVHADDRRNRRR